MADVRRLPNDPVPLHLRNAVTGMMHQMGYGKDYKYSHDYEGHFAPQEYLPPQLQERRYYHPGTEGAEREITETPSDAGGEMASLYNPITSRRPSSTSRIRLGDSHLTRSESSDLSHGQQLRDVDNGILGKPGIVSGQVDVFQEPRLIEDWM